MAPVEFEKNIKERLEERRIKPSEASWDKIRGSMNEEPDQKRPSILRYAIAAAMVIALVVAFWFKDTEEPVLEELPVVESPVLPEKSVNKGSDTKIQPAPVVVEEKSVQKAIDERDIQLATKDLVREEESGDKQDDVLDTYSEQHIEQKIAEVAAKVELLENNNGAVTDAEVESLLKDAQRELFADKVFQKENNVDAKTLLAGVEDELNKSFRDQVFDRLKQGFVKVRTAVADRDK